MILKALLAKSASRFLAPYPLCQSVLSVQHSKLRAPWVSASRESGVLSRGIRPVRCSDTLPRDPLAIICNSYAVTARFLLLVLSGLRYWVLKVTRRPTAFSDLIWRLFPRVCLREYSRQPCPRLTRSSYHTFTISRLFQAVRKRYVNISNQNGFNANVLVLAHRHWKCRRTCKLTGQSSTRSALSPYFRCLLQPFLQKRYGHAGRHTHTLAISHLYMQSLFPEGGSL